MRYIPNTDADIEKMLKVIGTRNVTDLFGAVPKESLPAFLEAATSHDPRVNRVCSEIVRQRRGVLVVAVDAKLDGVGAAGPRPFGAYLQVGKVVRQDRRDQ